MQSRTRLFPMWLAILMSLALTHANVASASTGVVVRLMSNSGGIDGPIVTTFKNAAGDPTEVTLLDDGSPPDVTAGDFHYSGATMLSGEQFTASITFGGTTHELGSIQWPEEDGPRDLNITEMQGALSAEASVGPGSGTAGEPSPPGDIVDAPADAADTIGKSLTSAPPRAPSVSFPNPEATAQDDTVLYLIAGALVLVLAFVAFLWLRNPGSASAGPIDSRHLETLPEPGIFGSGTPSLSDGLSLWSVPGEHQGAFLHLLLQGLAQHHRVLVVAPSDTDIPSVHGGPLYRSRGQSPIQAADAAISLIDHPGLPVAVVVVSDQIPATQLADYEAVLVPDVGVVAIVAQVEEQATADVEVSRADATWTLETAASSVRIEEHPWGVNVSTSAKETPDEAPAEAQTTPAEEDAADPPPDDDPATS